MELLTFLLIFICLSLIVGFVLFMLYADADLTLLYYHSLNRPRDFHNKVVWITGASSGIGEHLAYVLVKLGAKLALSGVNIERLTSVGKRCKEISNCAAEDILLVPFQINKFEDHDECVKKVLDHFGQIDILVNNAGISQRADFADVDIAVDQHVFNINVFGAVHLTRKVLKHHFLERKKGHVVVTSSITGKLGAPFSCSYTASKHALHGYFECLRNETLDENIKVTLVCPGPVFSGLVERCVTGNGEKYGHKQQPTDKKMSTERCCDLIATAIAYQLDECWISMQPILFTYYMAQYIPTIFRTFIGKFLFNKERVMKMRQGR
ncbi:dehydrogenase/reductase SDR family member 7-like [Argiope bruennichi]|uniref:dehydrogenase/reductase SDR family member 7-like n=1 Tax=Argiope bruennichi TaxID=94029 RepID=UPI0024954E06|nr:dehydrogenase/reductase SDR family member 7-like [Argiope bruennichi]